MKNIKISKRGKISIIAGAAISVVALVIVFYCLANIPIKQVLYKEVSGIRWVDTSKDNYETVQLKIDGIYHNYVFELFNNSDYYEGIFEISGIPETIGVSINVIFNNLPDTDMKQGMLTYEDCEIGCITADGALRRGYINIYMTDDENSKKHCAFPASSLEQARELRDELESWRFIENIKQKY